MHFFTRTIEQQFRTKVNTLGRFNSSWTTDNWFGHRSVCPSVQRLGERHSMPIDIIDLCPKSTVCKEHRLNMTGGGFSNEWTISTGQATIDRFHRFCPGLTAEGENHVEISGEQSSRQVCSADLSTLSIDLIGFHLCLIVFTSKTVITRMYVKRTYQQLGSFVPPLINMGRFHRFAFRGNRLVWMRITTTRWHMSNIMMSKECQPLSIDFYSN